MSIFHENRVNRIIENIKSENNLKIVLNRRKSNQSNSTRLIDYKKGKNIINFTDFDHILNIDTDKLLVEVEPNVNMENLVKKTLKYNLIPLVVPEFPNLTIGGVINGTGLESSSFKYGQVNDTIDSMVILNEEGEKINISSTENSDLFYGISGSFGTLGLIVKIVVKLKKCSPYVLLKYNVFNTYEKSVQYINKEIKNKKNDFIDGIVYSKNKTTIITGKCIFSDFKKYKYYNIDGKISPWFVHHVDKQKNNKEEIVDTFNYLFRYNQGAFWMGYYVRLHKTIPFGKMKFMHPLLKKYFNTSFLYKELHKLPPDVKENLYFIQDIYIPNENTVEFIKKCDENIKIYPLWLCPVKNAKNYQPFSCHYLTKAKGEFCIDVGVWGSITRDWKNCRQGKKINKSNVEVNKMLEEWTHQLNGRKMLYANIYYDKQKFWNIYDCKEWYQNIREKHKLNKKFMVIEDKLLK